MGQTLIIQYIVKNMVTTPLVLNSLEKKPRNCKNTLGCRARFFYLTIAPVSSRYHNNFYGSAISTGGVFPPFRVT